MAEGQGVHPNKGKYHQWTTYEGLMIVQGWARDGLSNKQIAHNIGISEATFYDWQNKHVKFSEAVKKGKEVIDREVENAVYEEARTGNIRAAMYWLNNRKPEQWNDRKQVEHSGTMNNNVNVFEGMSTEQLREALKGGEDTE